MRFTKWGEYGLLFCVHLAKNHTKQTLASELAKAHKIPTQYAQQILHRLKKGGVVKSNRGPKGGYLLIKSADELTAKDILQASEGTTFEMMCTSNPVFDSCSHDGAPCSVRFVWEILREKIDDALSEISLSKITASDQGISLVQLGKKTRSTTSQQSLSQS